MYFCMHHKNGGKYITGPFLLPVEKLLTLSSEVPKTQQLTENDVSILEQCEQELGIYGTEILEQETRLILRGTFSTLEYRAVFSDHSQMGYKLPEWCGVLGINESKHKNLLSGRTKLDELQSRQLANLCMAHSYIQELSALYLSSLTINQVHLSTSDYSEFGRLSLKSLHALKTSASVALRYYWSQRSHIDVCSLHPILKRLMSNNSENSLKVDNWLKTAEWVGMTEKQLAPRDGRGKALPKEHVRDAFEYLGLLQMSTDLTPKQHGRLIELARRLAVVVTENGSGLGLGNVSLEDAILNLMNTNEHAVSNQEEILAELVNQDVENRDGDLGYDGPMVMINI